MVDCTRFLEEYSDFRDGLLPREVSRAFEAHRDTCPSCARYDRVVSRGSRVFSDLPGLEPSADFLPRLHDRLRREETVHAPRRGTAALSASAALSLAALLAFASWIPALRPQPELQRLPAVAARAPQPGVEAAQQLFVAAPLLMHATLLHQDWKNALASSHDGHVLFSYFPSGAPASIRTAALD